MIARFVDEQRAAGHGVESICTVLREQGVQVAPRTYRSWRTTAPSSRTISDAQLVDTLRGLWTGSATGGSLPEILYGRSKMTPWLQRSGHENVSKHMVDRLMLNRDFQTTAPNRAWVTDFTTPTFRQRLHARRACPQARRRPRQRHPTLLSAASTERARRLMSP